MSDRKSSLGRGAASIFSGVSQQSEDENLISEEKETIDEKQGSDSDIQNQSDEGLIAEIQESSAEIQNLNDANSADESRHSLVDAPLGENLQNPAESQQSSIIIPKAKDEVWEIDKVALELAVKEGMKYPKVTVYSPLIASFMRYKEITIPRFKLSPEAEGRLEKVLKRENPQLWKAAEEGVNWNKKKESQRLREETNAVDPAFVEQSIEEGMKYPKVTIYSPIIAAFMRYSEITIPRFKLSPAVEGRLEKVLKREDAELWKAIEERISWRKRKR
jgi:uncharacterized surface protein with fasciclin (FAS1) repeats